MSQKVDCCSKYFLFGFNVIFWLVALFFIAVGVWAWFEKGFFDNLKTISSLPVDPVIVVNGIGLLMFILTFAGCVGALRENVTLLKCFAFCLSVIFFAELVVAVLGFVYKQWFSDQFATFVNNTIENYRDDPDLQNIIDFTQDYFQCCGGVGPDDWDNNIYFNCTSTVLVNGADFTLIESCGVPFSCCVKSEVDKVVNTQCGYGVRDKEKYSANERVEVINVMGCIERFEDWIKTNLYTVCGVLAGVALLQVIPICIANAVVQDINHIKSRWAYEARMVERQQERAAKQGEEVAQEEGGEGSAPALPSKRGSS